MMEQQSSLIGKSLGNSYLLYSLNYFFMKYLQLQGAADKAEGDFAERKHLL